MRKVISLRTPSQSPISPGDIVFPKNSDPPGHKRMSKELEAKISEIKIIDEAKKDTFRKLSDMSTGGRKTSYGSATPTADASDDTSRNASKEPLPADKQQKIKEIEKTESAQESANIISRITIAPDDDTAKRNSLYEGVLAKESVEGVFLGKGQAQESPRGVNAAMHGKELDTKNGVVVAPSTTNGINDSLDTVKKSKHSELSEQPADPKDSLDS